MRSSTEPKFRKYVEVYGFFSLTRKFGDNKLIDTATKTGIDVVKTGSKQLVQKTAKATGDLMENKMADIITSVGKTKCKEKEKKDKKFTYHQRKDSKLLMNWDCFDTI